MAVSKFLITTGMTTNKDYATKSEILDFSEEKNFQCFDWVDYPIDIFRATGGLVGHIAVICGGRYVGNRHDECYKVTQNKAVLLGKMTTNRFGAASVVMNNDILWITGGHNGSYLSSTDFLHLNGTVTEGSSGGRCSKITNPTLGDPLSF